MSFSDNTIALIGLGHMNGAILEGLLSDGHPEDRLVATTNSTVTAEKHRETLGINVLAVEEDVEANSQAVAQADVVVVGTKPAMIVETLRSLSAGLKSETVVVSVAAGITLDAMAAALPAGQPLVRTMPNVPLTVGYGVVGMAAGETVTEEQLTLAKGVFEASGTVFVVTEDQIGAVGAVAGSGPGYVFYFTELLAQAGEQLGLDTETAKEMARLTVAGSGTMLTDDEADASALRDSICTEGGTTQATVNFFDQAGMPKIVADGLQANIDRALELGN